MQISTRQEGSTITVSMDGSFTFEAHGPFKEATRLALETPELQAIHLDLAALSYMDSSSLGMLLLLREKAEAKGVHVVLLRPSPNVMAILRVVQFGRLFEIREPG